MKERVSRSRTPQKVPPETARSQGVEEELDQRVPEARGWRRSWVGSWGARRMGRKPAPAPCGGPGSQARHPALLGPQAPHTVLHPGWQTKLLPTARVRVLSLPLVFSPHRLQGKRKQALSARDVTSQRPPVTLSTPYSLARDLGLSKHQPERPPCSGPKPAVLWQRASS